jgi:excisionase family DNA binding protein
MIKISESTLNSWMRKGKIGYEKFGRGVRFSQSDIESAKIQSKAH